jgi:molybdopterin synthase subunit MoaE
VSTVALAAISADPLDPHAVRAAVWSSADGAVALFEGVVRDHDGGRGTVVALSYTAHPDAERVLHAAADAVAHRHPAVRLAAVHRIGELGVGDLAIVCAAASAHRADAFAACAELVDEIKRTVPIWKEQHFSDGTVEWVGAL